MARAKVWEQITRVGKECIDARAMHGCTVGGLQSRLVSVTGLHRECVKGVIEVLLCSGVLHDHPPTLDPKVHLAHKAWVVTEGKIDGRLPVSWELPVSVRLEFW